MPYIIADHPEKPSFCYVLNIRGSWNSRSKSDPMKAPEPSGTPLRYFLSKEDADLVASQLPKEELHYGNLKIMEVARDQSVPSKSLLELQELLKQTWTLESYSDEFKAGKLPYRDFDHSLKHVMKATGKLVAMTEEADHDHESAFKTQKVANYLADLIICAVRAASKYPYGQIDIEDAVIARIKEKADVPAEKLS